MCHPHLGCVNCDMILLHTTHLMIKEFNATQCQMVLVRISLNLAKILFMLALSCQDSYYACSILPRFLLCLLYLAKIFYACFFLPRFLLCLLHLAKILIRFLERSLRSGKILVSRLRYLYLAKILIRRALSCQDSYYACFFLPRFLFCLQDSWQDV